MDDADLAFFLARTPSPGVSRAASPAFTDPRVAFRSSFDDGDEAGITTGEEECTRTACYKFQSTFNHEAAEKLEDGLRCERNDPGAFGYKCDRLCETPNRRALDEDEDQFIDSGYVDDNGMEREMETMAIGNHTIRAIFPPTSRRSFDILVNEDTSELSDRRASEFEEQTMLPTSGDSTTEEEYEPERIIAERKSEQGTIQLLIQWVGYPKEKDFTWEDAKALEQSVPEFITSWRATKAQGKEKQQVNIEYTVEKILGKRKFKGIPHYLVAWKGFPLVGDRTWEPCLRLGVDVPELMEGFEMKRRRR
jgi:hypothetical protein